MFENFIFYSFPLSRFIFVIISFPCLAQRRLFASSHKYLWTAVVCSIGISPLFLIQFFARSTSPNPIHCEQPKHQQHQSREWQRKMRKNVALLSCSVWTRLPLWCSGFLWCSTIVWCRSRLLVLMLPLPPPLWTDVSRFSMSTASVYTFARPYILGYTMCSTYHS